MEDLEEEEEEEEEEESLGFGYKNTGFIIRFQFLPAVYNSTSAKFNSLLRRAIVTIILNFSKKEKE